MAEDNPSPAPFTPPTTEEDRLSCLRLIRSRRVGPATWRRLMAAHGSAAAALAELPAIARAAGDSDYTPCSEAAARAELAAGHRAGAFLLVQGEAGWPAALLDLTDPPPVLWAMGDAGLLERPALAMVGARNASALGLRMARRLAVDVGSAGLAVISGLARGIDAAAHAAALDTGTIAVTAGGIDTVYPAENATLAAQIAETGLILTEAPVGQEPQARHFPARNRLIAALARAVLVVEAAPRSGSLITAELALALGREVMAVPGHPLDARAGGCNTLLRDGATLIRSGADVLEALREARLLAPRPGAADPVPEKGATSGFGPGQAPERMPALTPVRSQVGTARPAQLQPGSGQAQSPAQDRQPARSTPCRAPLDTSAAAAPAGIQPALRGAGPAQRGKTSPSVSARRATSTRPGATPADRGPTGTGATASLDSSFPQTGVAPTGSRATDPIRTAAHEVPNPGARRRQPAPETRLPADSPGRRPLPIQPATQGAARSADVPASPAQPAPQQARCDDLPRAILDRLSSAPTLEDHLIRDLALPVADFARNVLLLELDGRVLRHPGGMLSRAD